MSKTRKRAPRLVPSVRPAFCSGVRVLKESMTVVPLWSSSRSERAVRMVVSTPASTAAWSAAAVSGVARTELRSKVSS